MTCVICKSGTPEAGRTTVTMERGKTLIVRTEDADIIHEAARYIAGQVATAHLETMTGAAHLPSLEVPEAFNTMVADWMAAEIH